jgi:hypothetical protein
MPHSLRPTVAFPALLISLAACGGSPSSDGSAAGSSSTAISATATATSVPSTDAEYEQLKSVTPVVACDLLPAAKIATVIPGVEFTAAPSKPPQMSGYTWDSRCEYNAGVGSMDFAKDTPTHVVQIYVSTVVSEAKAQANLKSRAETAVTTTNYTPQPELGPSAYTISNTGYVSAFLTKGQAEVQINVSDILRSTYEEKLARVVALAKGL